MVFNVYIFFFKGVKSLRFWVCFFFNNLIFICKFKLLKIKELRIENTWTSCYICSHKREGNFSAMMEQPNMALRPATAKLVARFIVPLVEAGLVTVAEYKTVSASLNHIARHGTPVPAVQRKLIKPQEVAELLGISYSGFRAIESTLPLRRRVIGKSVRYYLPEVVELMESEALLKGEEKTLPTSLSGRVI